MWSVMRPHRGRVYKGSALGLLLPFFLLPVHRCSSSGQVRSLYSRSPRVRGHHGALEAAVPAAASAFAAAAAAPGSAAATPPQRLKPWRKYQGGAALAVIPGSVRGFRLLGCGRRPGGVAEGEAGLRAPRTRDSCLGVPETPAPLCREIAAFCRGAKPWAAPGSPEPTGVPSGVP